MDLDTTTYGMIVQDVKQALDDVGVDTFGGWKERRRKSGDIKRDVCNTIDKSSSRANREKRKIREQNKRLRNIYYR